MRKFLYTFIILLPLLIVILVLTHPGKRLSYVASLAVEVPTIPKASPKYHLLFAGDIMLDRDVEASIYANGAGDWRYPFIQIASTTQAADIAFANLEGNLSDQGANQGSIYSFRMDPNTLEGLTYTGFDVLSLANNHSLDWGRRALVDTISKLNQAGIKTIGAGQDEETANAPAIFELSDGTKIAYLAYTNLYPKSFEATAESAGISHFSPELIQELIQELKGADPLSTGGLTSSADIVIVSLHWGHEYEAEPREWQKNLAYGLIDAGADLVIGHHPHVVQPTEHYKNGYIAYSLGNFVFDQFFSKATMEGLVVEAVVQNKQIIELKEIPITISPTFQPRLEHPF